MYEKIQPHWKHILHAPPPQMLKPEEYLVPFQIFYVKSETVWSYFKCILWNLKVLKKDKNKMNEQPIQSTPIYIWWKSNPNWDIKEAAQQTVCRDQECYRCLGAIVDCPELNITRYESIATVGESRVWWRAEF